MITIKDIAKQADVSIATVSRVLNDQSGVSEVKRQKVLKVAKKLGFNANRYNKHHKNKLPQVLVLLFDTHLPTQWDEEIIFGINMAKELRFPSNYRIEMYTQEKQDKALELLEILQAEGESLEGLVLIGEVPYAFQKALQYFRGQGCLMIFAECQAELLTALSTVHYDRMSIFPTLEEMILLLDRERTGVVFHKTNAKLSGEGFLDYIDSSNIVKNLQVHYPDNAIHIQNKGPFSPELFSEKSIIVLDSHEASLAAAEYYASSDKRPILISTVKGKKAVELLEMKKVDLVINFSIYALGFYALYALGKRIQRKSNPAAEIVIYPELYLPSQSKILLANLNYPVLIDERESSLYDL